VTRQGFVGLIGVVVHAIRGGDRPGEVRVVMNGLPHYLIAYCVAPLRAGTQILIINDRGSRQIDVEQWQPRGDIADVSMDISKE
jgi:hypothetical protein